MRDLSAYEFSDEEWERALDRFERLATAAIAASTARCASAPTPARSSARDRGCFPRPGRSAGSSGYWDEVAEQDDALPDGWRRHARAGPPAPDRGLGPTHGMLAEDGPVRGAVGQPGPAAVARHRRVGGHRPVPDRSPGRRGHGTGCSSVAADVRVLPFPAGTFDGVLSTSTLDHFEAIDDLHRALGELRRVLRPAGRLVLTLDNPANPLIRLRNALPPDVARTNRTGPVPGRVHPRRGVRSGGAGGGRASRSTTRSTCCTRPTSWAPGWRASLVGDAGRCPAPSGSAELGSAPLTGHYVAFSATAAGGA